MGRAFDYFVIFAEMRTGSNFLESNLDLFPGLQTYGETFNPYFMVKPNLEELFGVSVESRNADPLHLIERMKEETDGIPGFRFFHDHDSRVFEAVIDDPRCAKVVLTRNFVDAYVSRKVAWETDQWQLSNVHDVIKKKARFVPQEFAKLFFRITEFQQKVLGRLQRSGQTAFYIDYEDIQDIDVVNGLASFLGETTRIEKFSGKFKKQNPEPLEEKIVNYPDLLQTVKAIDFFDIGHIPVFEPRRTPMVPSYVTAPRAPLMFLPIQGGPVDEVRNWLAALDGVSVDDLVTGMNQREMRKWKRTQGNHRSFTVLRHPVARAHAAFCRHFLSEGPEAYLEIRRALRAHYDVPLPEVLVPQAEYDRVAHHEAFLSFLRFLKSNLEGQTTIRVDGAWASQGSVIHGFGQVHLPDHLLREAQLAQGLDQLCAEVGIAPLPAPEPIRDTPFTLAEIYNDEIETAVRAAYKRDYMLFGFGDWSVENDLSKS
ncbi:nodulation protein NodH [Maritimibacter sp. HL-12]|jgi:hypothetical protein|uniref:nodulation protein NodH n=1 Tax=Maritimibacter sp. HL-12 TaxID=1162418 RepID=UPI000A0F0A79|nr:nodulation protein NodH [Maritimibacter sp. HL-12]SMH43814.1 hypothetical protein SAMN05661107_1449 [Maritimibacter sp. HL-12]